MLKYVSLESLRFGHEFPAGDINPRVDGRMDNIEQLAASIKADGLIQPLAVCRALPVDEFFYVIDGNRRLAALKMLSEKSECGELLCEGISVSIEEEKIHAIEATRKSLMANLMQRPMHPVDQYSAFAQCFAEGKSVEEIAQTYAVEPTVVKQRLALGGMSPVIRSGWRQGKIRGSAAMAFTLDDDHARQEKAYKKLVKEYGVDLRADLVKDELGGLDWREIDAFLFVGREAYEAAGGTVFDDLFGEERHDGIHYRPRISDQKLLTKLANAKLKQKCEELVAEGWGWAEPLEKLPSDVQWSWRRDESAATSAEKKAKAGCIVQIKDGELDILYGVIKPQEQKAKEEKKEKKVAAATKKPEKVKEEFPVELKQDLIEQLTRATAKVIEADSDLALTFACASLLADDATIIGVEIMDSGLNGKSEKPIEFSTAVDRVLKMRSEEKLKVFAHYVAMSLDLRDSTIDWDDDESVIIDRIEPDTFNRELRKAFNAEDYFNRAPRELVLAEISQSLGDDALAAAEKLKKKDFTAFCLKELFGRGWLPAELRTVHYEGSGKKKAAEKKPAAKKSAKKAKR